jgi:hypothetical protein
MPESFWKLPESEVVRTPFGILREQAEALTKATAGHLEGIVERRGDRSERLILALSIRVPALDDYLLRLLEYHQPLTMYPGTLIGRSIGVDQDISGEQELVDSLRHALSSRATQQILQVLLAQAAEATA